MRKKLLVGNWKMNGALNESLLLVELLQKQVSLSEPEMVVCPPYPFLFPVVQALQGSFIEVGAQNVSQFPLGAYTGEVAASMLADVGVKWVIIGHSERRQYFGESDEVVASKVDAAISSGLSPIVCVGESAEERDSGVALSVVRRQLSAVLRGGESKAIGSLVVAYEPVWAIGTGRSAAPAQVQEIHGVLRDVLRSELGADDVPILYGGSVKATTAGALFSLPDVDGGLVGGASLSAPEFLAIYQALQANV